MASRYSNTGAAGPTCRTVYTSRPTTSSVASPPQKTKATGSSARIARTTRSGGRSKASSSVRNPARRRPSSSACTCSDSTSSRGLESNSSTPCGRLAGEEGRPRRPAGRDPGGHRPHLTRALGRAQDAYRHDGRVAWALGSDGRLAGQLVVPEGTCDQVEEPCPDQGWLAPE